MPDKVIKMSDITIVSAESYLASPCSSLPLPFAVCRGVPHGGLRIAGEGVPIDTVKKSDPHDDGFKHAFYRLRRDIGDMRRPGSETHSARQLFINDAEDAALAASFAAGCESSFDIAAFAASPFFNERLCVAVHERASGDCRALGFGLADVSTQEGWLYRVLIPGEYMGSDAPKLLIYELLRRMPPGVEFATANVSIYSKELVRVLRKCGFFGGDIWSYPVKKPTDTHIIDE